MSSSNATVSANSPAIHTVTHSGTHSADAVKSVAFNELGLSDALVSVLPAKLSTATQVQLLAIPPALAGKDILALAHTGSGKTLAFGLVLLEKLLSQLKNEPYKGAQALVIVPTRELAQQVFSVLDALANKLGIRCQLLCGGLDVEAQHLGLKLQPQLIVATPGRLLAMAQGKSLLLDESLQRDDSHQRDKTSLQRDDSGLQPIEERLKLTEIKYLVLDEADRLLEMGFWPDLQKIIAFMPASCQKLLFSATLPAPLRELGDSLLYKPQRIEAKAASTQVSEIEERAYLVNKGSKAQALIALLKDALLKQADNKQTGIKQPSLQTLVFINGKDDADSLAKKLNKAGLNAKALHGDKEQNIRDQTLAEFKQGTVTVLVATDLLARGIHLSELPQVINFALPEAGATYVHRIGRTGRMGAKGLAISLVCHGESQYLKAIEAFTQRPLRLNALEGFPVTDKPAPETAANASHTDKPKRAPRDKQANRRSMNKKSIKDFQSKK
ncbi:DEAD/DEAH box helicase [Shewanella sp. SR44-3]|uniref:DEAD/DEAH box helicase n=1 Tax=Shewanella sp. SR44-3 TaxID=2760936 RepID=UPI0015FDC2D9|nr:DEAD/DEAH box helicase [Shewanella sp. SR44-3]MBB1269151.1 DEAD/DEAH box helicase [Shewanella sp. SR44-3]